MATRDEYYFFKTKMNLVVCFVSQIHEELIDKNAAADLGCHGFRLKFLIVQSEAKKTSFLACDWLKYDLSLKIPYLVSHTIKLATYFPDTLPKKLCESEYQGLSNKLEP